MAYNPRAYFERLVIPAYSDWRQEMSAEHRARAAAIFMDSMADAVIMHLGTSKSKSPRQYRDDLAKNHRCFAIIRDVADTTKHIELNRKPRVINNAHDMHTQRATTLKEVESVDNLINFDNLEEWKVTLDGGETHSLGKAFDAVLQMWERELNAYNIRR